ncbi:hypothetical protein GGR56DRAFT_660805 [Xylariaceae sp. FL0804]|nr:hypothetical protein GGR56DRAFT_660805 [Xylariaceae sp. FL0804]
MYFLLVALSQVIPALRIGYIFTYIAPLAFVRMIIMGKEGYDDIKRCRRDNEVNLEEYKVLHFLGLSQRGTTSRSAHKLKSTTARKGARKPRDRLTDIREEEEQAEGLGRNLPSSQVMEISQKSKDLKVGDVLRLSKG